MSALPVRWMRLAPQERPGLLAAGEVQATVRPVRRVEWDRERIPQSDDLRHRLLAGVVTRLGTW